MSPAPEVRRSYWQIETLRMEPGMAVHTEFMVMNNDDILVVKGVNVAYGESKVLFDANLSVKLGQVVSCVGRNGRVKPLSSRASAGS